MTSTYNFGAVLGNIGLVCVRRNNLSGALAHFTGAEVILRALFPPDHPAITDCMHNISVVNKKLGNSDAAAAAAALLPQPPAAPRWLRAAPVS